MSDSARMDPLALVELSLVIEEATSGVRHNLRNKLGSIRNAAFYVKRRLSKTEAWAADPRLDAMASLIEADVTVANEFLGAGNERLHARHLGPAKPGQCVAQAVEHARIPRGVRIQVELPSEIVIVDTAELAVAVRCLIENAAEAMRGEGLVSIDGSIDGERYSINVTDHGPGIAEDVRELVTSPFFTTKRGHAGLGLNIAQRVAQRYGGRVSIGQSTPTVVSLALALSSTRERDDADAFIGR